MKIFDENRAIVVEKTDVSAAIQVKGQTSVLNKGIPSVPPTPPITYPAVTPRHSSLSLHEKEEGELFRARANNTIILEQLARRLETAPFSFFLSPLS